MVEGFGQMLYQILNLEVKYMEQVHRTLGGWETSSSVLYSAQYGNPYTPIYSTTAYSAVDYLETRGWKIPNFRKRRRSGELMPYTPFEQYSHKGSVVSGLYAWEQTVPPWTGQYWDEMVPWDSTYYGPTLQQVRDFASLQDTRYYVQAAAARIYASGWDVATFLAELTRTIQMFRDLLNKMLRIAAVRPVGTPLNLWLEGRYGWRTLSYDLDDLIKYCINLRDYRKRWTEKAGSTQTWVDTATWDVEGDATTDTNVSVVGISLGLRGSVAADIEPPKLTANPFLTYWEVTRLSFVVDWIVNIGQWLSALSFLALQTNYTAAGGIMLTYDKTHTITSVAKPNYQLNASSTRQVASKVEYVVRSPTSIPSLPQLKLRLDAAKVVDLAALIAQVTKLRR